MQTFQLPASDGYEVACYSWIPESVSAVILIAHGMGEHAKRYDWLAGELSAAGYAVFANDQRGHGLTTDSTPGYMGGDGWNRVLADAFELNRHIRSRYDSEPEDIPLVLLGHSMGAMLAQQYVTRYGDSIDALVLSGSPGFKQSLLNLVPQWLAHFETWRLGSDRPSAMLQNLLFGKSNKPFDRPGATGFEWLSRDSDQVRKYVSDDLCGFVLTAGSLNDLFQGATITQRKNCIAKIPRSLPIYIFSGSEDPVHGRQKDLERLVKAYRRHGIRNLQCKFYPGGRHEMFNEVNKDEVVQDLLGWLKVHVLEPGT